MFWQVILCSLVDSSIVVAYSCLFTLSWHIWKDGKEVTTHLASSYKLRPSYNFRLHNHLIFTSSTTRTRSAIHQHGTSQPTTIFATRCCRCPKALSISRSPHRYSSQVLQAPTVQIWTQGRFIEDDNCTTQENITSSTFLFVNYHWPFFVYHTTIVDSSFC